MFRIGLLGASQIAPSAIITPARVIDNALVKAVAARDKSRAAAYANEYDIPLHFDSYEALIASDEIDVVYIALPPSHHAKWSIAALKAGKHVICEKPIAMNVSEAKRMVEASTENARLVEAFHTAYHSSFMTCMSWVKNGRIGNIETINAHFGVPLEDDGIRHQFRPEAGGGSLMDMGCYPVQWVDAFAGGKVVSINATSDMTPSGVDGRTKAQLTFDNGVQANISCSMIGPGSFSAGLTIYGFDGVIEYANPLVPYDDGTLSLTLKDGSVETLNLSNKTTYHYQLEAILDGFENGTPLPTEGNAIIRQQQLIDNIYNAAGIV